MAGPLNRDIEKFLRETGMPPTVFGRYALKDPRFVFDLRMGREPGRRVCARVQGFMSKWRANGPNPYAASPSGRRV